MISILAFFVVISVLVFVHEFGHFYVARKCGVKVIRFSIGFGKVLFTRKDKQNTEFSLSLIPLGGYVQLYNGTEKEIDATPEQALQNKTILQRALIVFAGPLANFLFAILIYLVVFTTGIPAIKPVVESVKINSIAQIANLPNNFQITQIATTPIKSWEDVSIALLNNIGSGNVPVIGHLFDEEINHTYKLDLSNWDFNGNKADPVSSIGINPVRAKVSNEIAFVKENSLANQLGLKVGDILLSINHKTMKWQDLKNQIATGQTFILTVQKTDNSIQDFTINPVIKDGKAFVLGVSPKVLPVDEAYRTNIHFDPLTSLFKGIEKTYEMSTTVLVFMSKLITGQLSLANLNGVISIAKTSGDVAKVAVTIPSGWLYFLNFMALISVNLAVMNLLPILPLDGGHLILLALEKIRSKKLSLKFEKIFQNIGISFVITLIIFTVINDIINF